MNNYPNEKPTRPDLSIFQNYNKQNNIKNTLNNIGEIIRNENTDIRRFDTSKSVNDFKTSDINNDNGSSSSSINSDNNNNNKNDLNNRPTRPCNEQTIKH